MEVNRCNLEFVESKIDPQIGSNPVENSLAFALQREIYRLHLSCYSSEP